MAPQCHFAIFAAAAVCLTMGDETYLEAFIESINTLPHDVRRNLELMKDMDKTCS
jgi:hypothetical protein